MLYFIRTAEASDFSAIVGLYAKARAFMADHGNPSQWGTAYPPDAMIHRDISEKKLYVVWDSLGIHGVFYFCEEEDPTYHQIFQGQWRRDKAYGVIHRIAGDGSGGILRSAVDFALRHNAYLRLDTHSDNGVMQKALEKMGFCRCGIIYTDDGTPRIAYDFMK